MDKKPIVSIIVPCKEVDEYTKECVEYCKGLDYGNYEILLLPDHVSDNINGVRVILTDCVTPGKKRNIGIANAEGNFCAFIDSDAYPCKDWLTNAMTYLDDPTLAGVGGPGLTPERDSFMQKASGHVLSSFMVGSISNRYKVGRVRMSDDIHSCNFIARKTALEEVGGWDERYWPGEDTLICLGMRIHGKRLVEASDVVVYHHRRSLFKEHLKQVSRFGLHRGFFAKKFKANSYKLTYFMPSLFLLAFFFGVFASFINSFFLNILLLATTTYLILDLFAAFFSVKEMKFLVPVWLGIIATHVVYGVSFLAGLMKRDLEK